MTFDTAKNIHFIGIGGIGMSALARRALAHGARVTGSDSHTSDITESLKKLGAQIFNIQQADNVPRDCDFVVITKAIAQDNPELKNIIKRKLPHQYYSEVLGDISKAHTTIAVTGTHGKTTTTAMISHVMESCGKDPSSIIGSLLVGQKSNYRSGSSKYFVVEGCEFKKSFLDLHPSILVITNIEADHMDYYKNIDELYEAFHEIVSRIPLDGVLIYRGNEKGIQKILEKYKGKHIDACQYDELIPELCIIGKHNKKNASYAFAVAKFCQCNEEDALLALKNFLGVERRMQILKNENDEAVIVDDYAHHPSEIEAIHHALRTEYPDKRLRVLFHPHLYSRTKYFFNEFVNALSHFDDISLLPIFPARETFDSSISSEMIVAELLRKNVQARVLMSLEDAYHFYSENLRIDDIFISLGAGDQYLVANRLAQR